MSSSKVRAGAAELVVCLGRVTAGLSFGTCSLRDMPRFAAAACGADASNAYKEAMKPRRRQRQRAHVSSRPGRRHRLRRGRPSRGELQALPLENSAQVIVRRNGATEQGRFVNMIGGDMVRWQSESGEQQQYAMRTSAAST